MLEIPKINLHTSLGEMSGYVLTGLSTSMIVLSVRVLVDQDLITIAFLQLVASVAGPVIAAVVVMRGWKRTHVDALERDEKTQQRASERDLDNWRRISLAKAFSDVNESIDQILSQMDKMQDYPVHTIRQLKVAGPIQRILTNVHLIKNLEPNMSDTATRLSNSTLRFNTTLQTAETEIERALRDDASVQTVDKSLIDHIGLLMNGEQLRAFSKLLTNESMEIINRPN